MLPLEEVASVVYGTRVTRKRDGGTSFPVYGGGGETFRIDQWNRQDCFIISRFAMSVECVRFVKGQFFLNDSGLTVETKDRNLLSQGFLDRYLLAKTSAIYDLSRGTAQKNLDVSAFKRLIIPLPPLNEQKRIVAMLDQVFAEIESAEEVVKREVSAVQVFTQGILNDLLSRAGNVRVFTLAELMQDGLVCDHMDGNHGGNYPRKSEFIDSGVPYISAKAIVDGQVQFSAAKYLSPKRAALLRKGLAKDGDVLFAHNATVGPVAVLRTDEPIVVLGTSLTYYRCDSSRLWPDFLAHYMRSMAFVRQYQNVMGQSTRNQVPITTQRRFTFSIPSLPIQKRIAETMNAALSESSQLLTSFESKLVLFRGLGSSVLTEALRERA